MKNLLVPVAVAVLVGSPCSALAASANTSVVSGTANANVITPITMFHPAGIFLGFGTFSPGAGGTVTIASDGTPSLTGGVTYVPGAVTTSDRFFVVGDFNRNFLISTTGGTVSVAGSSMSFTTTPSSPGASLIYSGINTFTVGGTLTVPNGISGGTYTGSYTATVVYN